MLITTKTSNGAKIARRISIGLLTILLGTPIYMFYSASDTCREFESISLNVVANENLRDKISEYLMEEKVQNFFKTTSGEVFSVGEIGVPFPLIDSAEGFHKHGQDIQLVIKTDKSDRGFRLPYDVKEVGVGYSRAFLMFTNEAKYALGEGIKNLKLSSNSYVNCRVYDD